MSNTLTTLDKLRLFRKKYFPERQIFLRSDGRVRFLTISANLQIAMSTAATGFLVWGIITSYAYLTHDQLIEEKNATISAISANYQSLSNDFSVLEQEVERRAKQIEDRQKFLEEIIGNKSPGKSEVIKIDSPETSEHSMVLDTAPKDNAPSGLSLFHELLGKEPAAPVLLTTADRRRRLLTRLQVAERRQAILASALLVDVRTQLETIDETIKPTSLRSEDLIRQWQGDETAMGGPYRPDEGFQPVFDAEDHIPYTDLLEEWQRLEIAINALDSFPVGKPTEKYYVSSKFGRRRDPLKKTWASHPGLDMAGWPGSAINAAAPGKVVHAGWFGPYGRMVEIEHGNGFKTRYGHMKKVRVKKGEMVNIGTRIGDMGKSGRTTGTHVHYEIWFEGKLKDPAPFLKAANDVLKIQERYEETSE